MSKPLELAPGTVFGHLTVIRRAGSNAEGNSLFEFRCDCGKIAIKLGRHVVRGQTKTCGRSCSVPRPRPSNYLTGLAGAAPHPLYRAWTRMHVRCSNTALPEYVHYGGRGIKVCEAWHEFVEFFADMAPSWEPRKSLERKNNNEDYAPGNCRWASAVEQCNNRRSNRWIATPAGDMTLAQAARHYQVDQTVLRGRINLGWPVEKALRTAVRKRSTI